jgi:hypothetical protein
MHMITGTQTGTVLVNGIEYNEYPPPEQLLKVMKRQWAECLLGTGLVRLHKLEYYRRLENELLGDPNDGEGLYHLGGHPIQTGSVNEVYAWCLSLPVIEKGQLLLLAQHGGYDCTVVVRAPEEFFRRVKDWLCKYKKGFQLHCGLVNYNRGEEVDKETLNSQKFNFNVFQKAPRFGDDMEYRISITNWTFKSFQEDHLDLLIGDCSGIMSIERLPDNSPEPL